MQLPKIAVIQEPPDHARGNLACTLRLKLVPGHELKIAVGAGQCSLEPSVEKAAAGLHYDHAGSAAIRMAIGQPEEGHPLNLALPAAAATTASVSNSNPPTTEVAS
jgi:hypothetical protein